jgi:hypothetical protein
MSKPAINRKALDLLHIYTSHTFDISRLAGGAMKEARKQIVSALHGQRMPVSKSGISVIQRHFYLMSGISLEDCTCIRDREIKFAAWAKEAVK